MFRRPRWWWCWWPRVTIGVSTLCPVWLSHKLYTQTVSCVCVFFFKAHNYLLLLNLICAAAMYISLDHTHDLTQLNNGPMADVCTQKMWWTLITSVVSPSDKCVVRVFTFEKDKFSSGQCIRKCTLYILNTRNNTHIYKYTQANNLNREEHARI